ncbi:MAG: transporter substrate-binding domain-containing protein [Snowella sp.]|nr:transporter substrate-binding domain-containing protein [Snowella sp.]
MAQVLDDHPHFGTTRFLPKFWNLNVMAFALGLAMGLSGPCSPAIAAELSEIIQRGKLIVGVKDNTRPLGFQDAQGNLQGFEIDIAKRLAQSILGKADAIALQPVTNQARLQLILENKVDLVVARVSVNDSRSRLVEFSPYYYLDSIGLISNQPEIKTLGDLRNRTIGVLNGSDAIALIRSNLSTAQLVGVQSYQEAFSLLETGKIDAFAADKSLLTGWVQEYPTYHILPVQLSEEALAVVMPKGMQYWGLRQMVNAAINEWKKSGWLKERARYWGLPESFE